METIQSYLAIIPLPLAVVGSIFLNIAISIIGFLPSAFLTAINVTLFGYWGGFWTSFIGEALGSLVAFWLYRKGFRRFVDQRAKRAPFVYKLINASPREAFFSVIGLRILPFIPSGLVTLYAAVSTMRFGSFAIASSLGKFPALFIEVSATYAVVQWMNPGQLILLVLAVFLLSSVWVKFRSSSK